MTIGYNIPRNTSLTFLGYVFVKSLFNWENLPLRFDADHKMKDFDPEAKNGWFIALGSKSLALGVNVSF